MDRVAKIEAFIGDRYTKEDYPTLEAQFQQWNRTKPLQGLRVVDVTPIFKNTLLKHRSLLAAGAELVLGESSFISADSEVLEFCKRELGIEVVNPKTLTSADIILDCAASYIESDAKIGYVELTRSGIEKYGASGKRCYAADSSRIKKLETELGTGESFFRAMESLGYSEWSGKKLVVFGSGKVGRGIIRYGISYGATVVAVSDPTMGVDGVEIIDYRDREAVDALIEDAYCIVMATGVEGALEKTISPEALERSGAMLANMGAEDEYGDSIPAERTLCNKRTINFILDEPTHLRYIDATMALHNYGAEFLVGSGSASGIIVPSKETEEYFLEITAQRGKIGDLLDRI